MPGTARRTNGPPEQHGGGPAWLGIGAQRSGTTWLTDLLLQHPKVGVPKGVKELHKLYLGLVGGWTSNQSTQYRRLFDNDTDVRLGEWTPYYMRAPWAIEVARREVSDDAPILVLLRDPVSRFESSVRLAVKRLNRRGTRVARQWIRNTASDAIWAGYYASQLAPWISAVGRDRLRIMQYERTVRQPQEIVNAIWADLGLEPITLRDIDRRSHVSTDASIWQMDDDLRRYLTDLYREESRRCMEQFDFDPELWPSLR